MSAVKASQRKLRTKVGNEFSWFGWPDWPRNVSAHFFGRSGKVLHGAFSIVGMASQPHNVNKGIPDDRMARSRLVCIYSNQIVYIEKTSHSKLNTSVPGHKGTTTIRVQP